MQKITKAGIFDIPEDDYHADPCPAPSLSSTLASTLVWKSPRHAWHQSSRLNPQHEQDEAKRLDFGKAAHNMVLEDGAAIIRLPYDAYRKVEAKKARDQAYAENIIPLLEKDHDRAIAVKYALMSQLRAHEDASDAFTGGKAEQSLFWFEEKFGIWCRARIDYVQKENWLEDYKTTEGSASPEDWIRSQLFSAGKDMQAAFYLRGWKSLTGETRAFRFIVQEVKDEPYLASVIGVAGYELEQANEKIEEAMELWAECLRTGNWPGYPNRICWAKAPVFADKAWQERQIQKHLIKSEGKSVHASMLQWQAPIEGIK